jgi:hypothetical protein
VSRQARLERLWNSTGNSRQSLPSADNSPVHKAYELNRNFEESVKKKLEQKLKKFQCQYQSYMGLKVRILKEQNSITEERTKQAENYRSSKQLSKEE